MVFMCYLQLSAANLAFDQEYLQHVFAGDDRVAVVTRVARTQDEAATVVRQIDVLDRAQVIARRVCDDEIGLTPQHRIDVAYLPDKDNISGIKVRLHAVAIDRERRVAVVHRRQVDTVLWHFGNVAERFCDTARHVYVVERHTRSCGGILYRYCIAFEHLPLASNKPIGV